MKAAFIFFIMGVLALWGGGNAQAQESIRIVVFGDSLMSGYDLQPDQGFAPKLEQKLKAMGWNDVSVIDMSVATETTADGLDRVNSVIQQRPDMVIFELGSNDAERGISIDIINSNLANIVATLHQNNMYVILVGSKALASKDYAYSWRFQSIYTRIADAFNIPLYPFILQGIIDNSSMTLADGLHPNAKGVGFMLEQIYPLVDAGLRWKWQVRQQQQQWIQQQDTSMPKMPLSPDISSAPR